MDPFVAYLHQRLAEGYTNQSRLWREMCEQGFTGTRSLVSKWIRSQRDTTAHVPHQERGHHHSRLPSSYHG